ncbi:MAG TPA: hypothetical protein VN783_01705 [Thermoanaerobaculia bacterium]|nr:hypothetical protein [Thermoanaerobaculia bacterium]
MPRERFRRRAFGACGALLALLPSPASAWTPRMQQVIALDAARLAPSDLYRQIGKHRPEYEQGALAPFSDRDPERHAKNPDGSGVLDRVIPEEIARAVALIQEHRPFAEIVGQLGRVSHYLADANNPLAASNDDAEEGRYFADYLYYVESVEPRLPIVFYGLPAWWDRQPDVDRLVRDALARSRATYPAIEREYRRIDFGSGRERFDDRSSAFAVAALAFDRAVTDVAIVLRSIWLAAGGTDDRQRLPEAGEKLLVLPRGRLELP